MNFEKDCIVIHNHPDGLIFSEGDISSFINHPEIKVLGAVGNDGSAYFIEKLKNFDDYEFNEYFTGIRMTHLTEMPPEEHIKFIEEVMENVKEYEVNFIKG